MSSVWKVKYALPVIFSLCFLQHTVEGQISENKVNERLFSILPGSTKQSADLTRHGAKAKIAEYEELLKNAPNDAVLHNNLGAQYALERRFDEAATSMEESIRLNPKVPQFHVNIAIVYSGMGRYDEALASIHKALTHEPNNIKAKKLLCDLYTLKARHGEAVACYEAIQEPANLDKDSTANYGYALLALGKADRATQVLEAALTAFPEDASLLNGLGMAQFKKKKYELCVATFKRALEIAPDRGEVRFNLAIAQMANRNRAAALRQYSFLKDSNPDLAKKVYKELFRDKLLFVDEVKR